MLEVTPAAHLAEPRPAAPPNRVPRTCQPPPRPEDGPHRAHEGQMSLLICFVLRTEVRERKKKPTTPNPPALPLGEWEATSDKTVIH